MKHYQFSFCRQVRELIDAASQAVVTLQDFQCSLSETRAAVLQGREQQHLETQKLTQAIVDSNKNVASLLQLLATQMSEKSKQD